MITITLSLGSNINPEEHITQTTEFIQSLCTSSQSSSWYHSPARGFKGDDFINTVMLCTTDMSLSDFRETCQQRQQQHGKIYNSNQDGYHNRTIDIDILLIQDSKDGTYITHNSKSPHTPHPRMHVRDFVLVPLLELVGDIVLPHTHQTISYHIAQL